jgi:ribosomal protein L3
MRTGVIAKKVGMTRLFQADGRHVPVTVLQLDELQVVGRREKDRDGYSPCSWAPARRRRRMSPSRSARHSARPRSSRRRRSPSSGSPRMRCSMSERRSAPTISSPASWSTSTGVTQGKGFAGAMKRWGFGAFAPPTAFPSRTARTVRPASARIRARSSRTRRWPATWAPATAPSRISRSFAPTRSAACFSSRARCPDTRAAG